MLIESNTRLHPVSPRPAGPPQGLAISQAASALAANPRALEHADPIGDLLDPAQHTALTALAAGQTIAAAAQAAGVHRNTLPRWIRSNAAFRAAFNAWQQALIDSTQARLLRAAEAAAATIDQAIMAGDARLALSLLKHLKLGLGAQPGPSDLTLAGDEVAILREEEREVLHCRADKAGTFDLSPRRRENRESDRLRGAADRERAAKAGDAG